MPRFLMNGLTVESELPLTGYGCSEAVADVHVRYAGARAVPAEAPGEGQLLQLSRPGLGAGCSTVRREDGGYLVRVNGGMDFEISADLRTVDIWLDHSWPAAMMPVLSSCLLMAVLLGLRGDYALHASAVELEGRALAFVGGPGAGKSTISALMCSEGARLVTDDLLRTDLSTGRPRCYLGSAENRLRFVPSELGLANSGQDVPRTVDERVLHRPAAAGTELCPLVGVVSPVPERSASQLELVRLDAGTAVMELTANLNVRGWRDVSRQHAAFAYVSRFAAAVPVYRARIPWGPPFRPDVTRALMEQTGLGVAR